MTATVQEQRPVPADPSAAPDWSATSGDVRCPLCDYDLRGLSEPRCPECGYRFTWAELSDPARKRHRYLFEHHPRRNVWSFVRTMLGGLRPRRFWSSLRPSQPSRRGRLVVYWLVSAMALPVAYAGLVANTAVRYATEHEQRRNGQLVAVQQYYRRYAGRPPQGSLIPEIVAAGGPQQWVDGRYPPTGSPRYVLEVHRLFYEPRLGHNLEAVGMLVAWPWATLATLMIFRASMRRAKVNGVHVLRAALYCCDWTLWLGLLALLAVPPLVEWLDLGRYIGFRDAAVSAVLFAGITTWRLSAAYRHYLQFDRPLATAASAQVIVVLVAWVYLYGHGLAGVG